ncbi:MAG TPA: hypothetical protein DCQ31_09645, partial [Bacteroidales bacterium]|nr:hypothetical protein [Bacteroidales bacterium]
EIRTPLTAICGFSGLISSPKIDNSKRESFAEIIKTSSDKLLEIVTDILTISSLETGQEQINIQKVCINSIIAELLAEFKQQVKNKQISIYAIQPLADDRTKIYTDKQKLTIVLRSLIANAIKFTNQGFIEFGYNLIEENLEFYVKDTGVGIKPELQEKIFESFRQADLTTSKNYGGTGLGLSIAKGYIKLLEGKIWVISSENKGTAFFLTIPYRPINELMKEEKPGNKNNNGYILVAEDEELNFYLIEEYLNQFGFKFIHAKNGLEAIKLCQINQEIKLVLMDIKMPVMSGDEAALIIKKTNPKLPIIALTAYAMNEEKEKYGIFFDDYITKPIDEQYLKKIITKHSE